MRLVSLLQAARTVAANVAAVAVALALRPDIIVVICMMLAANLIVSIMQIGITNRIVPIRPKLDLRLSLRLIKGGFPFWSNNVFLTVYIWIDSVLLSMLVSTREVGYYAAPVQLVTTLGFLPAIVTFAIFPSLSSSFRNDFEQVRLLTRASLTLLISLGLPISAGAALVGPNIIAHIFGPEYAPSGPTMTVLALSITPSYIAILAYYVLAAVDRQRVWAYVLGVVAVVNPIVNFITIPYFQTHYGHGSIGAAAALLLTDVAISGVGLALIPSECLKPVRSLVWFAFRVVLATGIMALPVWLLRDRFLVVPVTVGIIAYTGAAFLLGVFRSEGYALAWASVRGRLRTHSMRRAEANRPAA
jgi:O-antigen/teichoic acid export membrane protein